MSTYTIHLKNDKSYSCDENTSLLRAALDNDISLEYSCFEARCRSCRVKILQGKVENLQDEKVLTAEEKAAGYVLSCNVVPRSEVILDVEDLAVKLPKPQVTPCKINNITVLTPNIVEVVLRLPPKIVFQFLPGQYVDIIRNGQKRSYSISHSQSEANELRLFIRNYEGGLFSQYWFNEAKPNDLLRMEGPLGTFFYRNNPNCEEIVLLATGTGIAPIKAILEQLQSTPELTTHKKIWLLWGGRKKEDLFWQPKTTLPNFTYIPVLSREEQWQGAKGYVQEIALQQPILWQKAQVYACGSEVMIQSAQKLLSEQGLKEENFFADAFV
ncbi:2Fe-2S iron-sulfur cluster binding domain-containing protein [Capnocytophaga genosp. AHN8471]|uniref:FAD-binding oxidoreductase n=1 Tax=Capnocytophaga genosp. AHN8471 TaxID=327574 RepID=UPI0019340A7B|nr:FAD-binding oxidoreductase [Capnocytophaga genosp. AHN8471]MBM0653098.1 2Fe-2S iron-sulfur cluster binding domain-containing protein [Capnocytophaga genosp. AHN8471]